MKLNNIYGILSMAIMLAITACEPIEIRDELSNSFDPDNIDLQVVQATPGGNKLSIQMNTPGVTGYWSYIIDKKYTDRVEVVFPFTGTHEFTYYITTPYLPNGDPSETEYLEKTVSVEITKLDERLPDPFYYLVGENLEGKTWVFDGGPTPDGRKWWYMSPPDDAAAWETAWWNAAGDCCPPTDAAGKMVFDLKGGSNYTYYSTPDADGLLGTFGFSPDYKKLFTKGVAKILGNEAPRGNPNGEYVIVKLTADEMILYVPNNEGGTGWTWIFKPE